MVAKLKMVGDVRPTLNEDGKYVCLTKCVPAQAPGFSPGEHVKAEQPA